MCISTIDDYNGTKQGEVCGIAVASFLMAAIVLVHWVGICIIGHKRFSKFMKLIELIFLACYFILTVVMLSLQYFVCLFGLIIMIFQVVQIGTNGDWEKEDKRIAGSEPLLPK